MSGEILNFAPRRPIRPGLVTPAVDLAPPRPSVGEMEAAVAAQANAVSDQLNAILGTLEGTRGPFQALLTRAHRLVTIEGGVAKPSAEGAALLDALEAAASHMAVAAGHLSALVVDGGGS